MMVGVNIMSIYGMSDRAILREMGRRLNRKRLDKNVSQQELAEMAGLNRTTVSEIEQGKPFAMLTFIQILRALDALDELDSLLPDPGISPLQLAKMKGKVRRRASKYSKDSNKEK
jgi:transcriptional regulator with XRE-family HTH domain